MIEFTWDIIYRCNYRCSYCWWDPQWDELEQKHPTYPSPERWEEAWRRVAERCGRSDIAVLGGEPFVYQGFPRLLAALSKMHLMRVTTNLSTPREKLEAMIATWDPASVSFGASFHPEFAEIGEFMEKVALLKRAGFGLAVHVVAHPSFWDKLPDYRGRCEALGVNCKLLPFNGSFEGRSYPASYTPEQRAWLGERLKDPAQGEYIVDLKRTLGKRCYAGTVYANVKPDGVVLRCGGAGGKGQIGNIFDADFAMQTGAAPCPVEHCICQEYVYLAELYEKKVPAGAAR